jgi:hypothetical protein
MLPAENFNVPLCCPTAFFPTHFTVLESVLTLKVSFTMTKEKSRAAAKNAKENAKNFILVKI